MHHGMYVVYMVASQLPRVLYMAYQGGCIHMGSQDHCLYSMNDHTEYNMLEHTTEYNVCSRRMELHRRHLVYSMCRFGKDSVLDANRGG